MIVARAAWKESAGITLIDHRADEGYVTPVECAGDDPVFISRVRADNTVRSQVLETVQLFRAKVVDVSPEALTIEATGTSDKIGALLRMLEPYGIRELVQSGMVAVGRGARSITATSPR